VFFLLVEVVIGSLYFARRYMYQLNEKLQEAVEDAGVANKCLKQARREAEKQSQIKSEFIAYLCHELRNPLHIVVSYMDFAFTDGVNRLECLDALRGSTALMISIVNDVLDMSRIEAGKMTLEQLPFDLHRLIASIVASNKPAADVKGPSSFSLLAVLSSLTGSHSIPFFSQDLRSLVMSKKMSRKL
jgi:signal transduction histidine kinase